MLTAIARSLCITSAMAGTPVPLYLGITVPCGSAGAGQCRGGLFGCCVLITHHGVGACCYPHTVLPPRWDVPAMVWCQNTLYSSHFSCLCLPFCTNCKVNVLFSDLAGKPLCEMRGLNSHKSCWI